MEKTTRIASAIRHVVSAPDGDVVAVALFEHIVSLWSIATGECISEFETVLDFGGNRLALSHARSACLAAAYHVHGLACYDTPSGAIRWHRKDLKKIQRIVISPDARHAYCCFDKGPCQIIAISDGATTERLRGIRGVWIGFSDGYQLHESGQLSVLNRLGKPLFRIAPDSFAVLDASFSRQHLAISESDADIRVFEISSGREVARPALVKNHHVVSLSAFSDDSVFHGVQWNYCIGGPKHLLRFGPQKSKPEIVRDIGQPAEVAFCNRGTQLLTSEGELIDCRSGRTVRTLRFPQCAYSKE